MIDLTAMTDEELTELSRAIPHEWDRREALPAVEAGQAEVIAGLRESGAITKPAAPDAPAEVGDFSAWINPGTDHAAMYLQGDEVSHNGAVWRSEHPGLNHWEPGVAGVDYRIWRDVTHDVIPLPDEPDSPEGSGPEDEPDSPDESAPDEWQVGVDYKPGDRVTYNGQVYEVVQEHTSAEQWLPDTLPALYEAVE